MSLEALNPAPRPRVLAFVGGLRSGKSALAQARFSAEAAARGARSLAYLATLSPGPEGADPELDRRVRAHKAARPADWALIEAGSDLPGAARACLKAGHDAWILDGLGAWAALRLEQGLEPALAELDAFLDLASGVSLLVLVLDEVGQGGVPGHPAARAFADLNGALNQRACGRSDAVWAVQAGLALRLK